MRVVVLQTCHPEDPKTEGRDHECGDDVVRSCDVDRRAAQGAMPVRPGLVFQPPRRRRGMVGVGGRASRPPNRGGAAKLRGPDFQRLTKHVTSSGAGKTSRFRGQRRFGATSSLCQMLPLACRSNTCTDRLAHVKAPLENPLKVCSPEMHLPPLVPGAAASEVLRLRP